MTQTITCKDVEPHIPRNWWKPFVKTFRGNATKFLQGHCRQGGRIQGRRRPGGMKMRRVAPVRRRRQIPTSSDEILGPDLDRGALGVVACIQLLLREVEQSLAEPAVHKAPRALHCVLFNQRRQGRSVILQQGPFELEAFAANEQLQNLRQIARAVVLEIEGVADPSVEALVGTHEFLHVAGVACEDHHGGLAWLLVHRGH
mmetsp:Transcript_98617/g.284533  ORF Transcript_98617/g.284533 Transcript_98617/m.284533 type:complete len:201 (-) Transcript_98617:1123-1725(-)